GLGVDAMEKAMLLGDVNQAAVDRAGADRRGEIDLPAFRRPRLDEAAIGPDQRASFIGRVLGVEAFRADVAFFGHVDAQDVARLWVRAEIGADAHADIEPVADDHGRGHEIVEPDFLLALGTIGLTVEFPDDVAGFGFEAVEDAVAARENHL